MFQGQSFPGTILTPQGEVRRKRRTEENGNIIIETKKTVIPRNGPHSLFCFQQLKQGGVLMETQK